jgi:hypothetical protein
VFLVCRRSCALTAVARRVADRAATFPHATRAAPRSESTGPPSHRCPDCANSSLALCLARCERLDSEFESPEGVGQTEVSVGLFHSAAQCNRQAGAAVPVMSVWSTMCFRVRYPGRYRESLSLTAEVRSPSFFAALVGCRGVESPTLRSDPGHVSL